MSHEKNSQISHDEELGLEELEAVQGGALNSYLKLKGQKQGAIKESVTTKTPDDKTSR